MLLKYEAFSLTSPCLSLTSLSFKVRLHPSLLPLIPLSPYLSPPSPPPQSLCSIFSILLNYLTLPPFLPSFLPPPLNSSLYRYLSSFPSILISLPLSPQPNPSIFLFRFLSPSSSSAAEGLLHQCTAFTNQ